MSASKLKVVKKTERDPAELSVGERWRAWMDEHSRWVAAGIVSLAVLLLLSWAISAYVRTKETRARRDYAQVIEKWPAEAQPDPKALEGLVPELERFIQQYGGTDAALVAKLDLARAYFQAGRYEDALRVNREALGSAPADLGLKPMARYQLALTYEALGKRDEAIAQWTALKAEGAAGFHREADWRLGRLLTARGEHAKAVEHYEQALKAPGDYPPTPLLEEELAKASLSGGAPKDDAQAKSAP